MADATALGTFLDEYRTQLVARAGMADVVVVTGAGDQVDQWTDLVELYRADVTREQIAMGTGGSGLVREVYSVEGRIRIRRTGTVTTADGADATAKAARDRALAILNELVGEFDDDETVNATAKKAALESYSWEDGLMEEGHVAEIEFVVEAEEHTT